MKNEKICNCESSMEEFQIKVEVGFNVSELKLESITNYIQCSRCGKSIEVFKK